MKKYGYIKDNKKKNDNINKVKKFGKKVVKTNNNLKKKSKNSAGPPSNKKKVDKKIYKKFTIRNLKIIDNSSSISILKESQKNIPQMNSNIKNNILNNNLNKNKPKTKKLGKIKFKKKLNLNKVKVNKGIKSNKIKNITVLPTQGIPSNKEEENNIHIENGKKKNLEEYTLINMDLNLSRNNIYYPPDSHIILDNYTLEEAMKYDKRELCAIFYIYALSKQIFLHTFLYRSPL